MHVGHRAATRLDAAARLPATAPLFHLLGHGGSRVTVVGFAARARGIREDVRSATRGDKAAAAACI